MYFSTYSIFSRVKLYFCPTLWRCITNSLFPILNDKNVKLVSKCCESYNNPRNLKIDLQKKRDDNPRKVHIWNSSNEIKKNYFLYKTCENVFFSMFMKLLARNHSMEMIFFFRWKFKAELNISFYQKLHWVAIVIPEHIMSVTGLWCDFIVGFFFRSTVHLGIT